MTRLALQTLQPQQRLHGAVRASTPWIGALVIRATPVRSLHASHTARSSTAQTAEDTMETDWNPDVVTEAGWPAIRVQPCRALDTVDVAEELMAYVSNVHLTDGEVDGLVVGVVARAAVYEVVCESDAHVAAAMQGPPPDAHICILLATDCGAVIARTDCSDVLHEEHVTTPA